MRRRLIAIAIVAAALHILATTTPAQADTECQVTDPQSGQCLVYVEVPGNPGSPGSEVDGPSDSGSGQACYWDPKKQGVAGPPAGPVPCTSDTGYWSNTHNCYIEAVDPQPPATDPAWQGHEPGDGAVYRCFQPQTGIVLTFWSADPPEGAELGPTPREVAEIAIDQMNLSAIDIGITPSPTPGSVGLVGMPVWLWADNPTASTFGPSTASASAGGITVTATARVHDVTWSMGDGTEVVCTTAGTPYLPKFGDRPSPDCGHRYEKSSFREPNGRYVVTATSDWVITWSGAGQTGTIRLNGLQRSVEIAVGEAQVLVH